MLLNEKFNRQVQQLTASLVSTLTEFEKGDQHHDSCVQYALSYFHNHRFLSPNSHQIHRQFLGLVDKFLIHSQPEKSQSLKENYEEFLKRDITKTSFSNSDVHYGLLDVILHLSDHPLKKTYKRTIKAPQLQTKDDFNWTAHLLDGEDCPSNWEWDESPLGSDEEAAVDEPADTEATIPQSQGVVNRVSNFQSEPESPDPLSNLVPSYWKSSIIPCKPTLLCSLNSPLTVMQTKANVEEVNVMREIVWLLGGHEDLFIFPRKDGKYRVSSRVHLSHLTNEALQSALEVHAACGDVSSKLRNFTISTHLHVSSTYEAFASSLSLYVSWLTVDLLAIEKKIKVGKGKYLLPDLQMELSPHLLVLSFLNTIFNASIDIDKPDEPNCVKSSRLLGVLYHALMDESNVVERSENSKPELTTLDVVYNLWLDTSKPYLDIVDKWMCNGVLDDPKEEFILRKKNPNADCQRANFWLESVIPTIDNVDEVCPWLCPMLDAIVSGGKSMEILRTLSALTRKEKRESHKVLSVNSLPDMAQSVYEYFLEHLGVGQTRRVSAKPAVTSVPLNSVGETGEGPFLLRTNFELLFTPPTPLDNINLEMNKHFRTFQPLPVFVSQSLRPIVELKSSHSNRQLVRAFFDNYDLLDTLNLFHNFHLMAWGDVMHHFVIGVCSELQTSDAIVNDLVGINVLMQEAMSDKSMSQGVFVHLRPPSNEERKEGGLLVTSKKTDGRHQSIDVTNRIELQWKVEWPLSLVLSEKCIEIYNKIFSYLFQIRRAVHCVESLKFTTIYRRTSKPAQPPTFAVTASDAEPMTVNEKRHRMALLRTRILHLLQHWHSFVMTSVVQAEKHELSLRLSDAKTLDDILLAHDTFLERICSLCLLDERNQASKLVHGTLKKIMMLAITFNMLWNCGLDLVTDRSLLKHETAFHECSEFLGRILKTIANRGAVPILDSLAYAILT